MRKPLSPRKQDGYLTLVIKPEAAKALDEALEIVDADLGMTVSRSQGIQYLSAYFLRTKTN